MLTPADYAVIAVQEEIHILFNTECDENSEEKKCVELHNRLKPLAEAGHQGAQLTLATKSVFPEATRKQWLMHLDAANHLLASLKIAKRHFMGIEGFTEDYSLAAKYLAEVLKSNDPKLLYETKDFFKVISTNPKVNQWHSEVTPEDSSRLAALTEVLLNKHQVALDTYLEAEYPYPEDNANTPDEDTYLAAAKEGDIDKIQVYLENGGNPFVKNSDVRTALHIAASSNQLEAVKTIVKFHLAHGLPVDSIEFQRQDTPLSLACARDQPKIVLELLQAGANPFMKKSQPGNVTAYKRARLLTCNKAIKVLDEYTGLTKITLKVEVDDKEHYTTVKVGHCGSTNEKFIGEISCLSLPFDSSYEADPILGKVNDHLEAKGVPEINKIYQGIGITSSLTAKQALHVVEFLKEMQPQGKIVLNVSKQEHPEVEEVLDFMQKLCQRHILPSLSSLCVGVMKQQGSMPEVVKSTSLNSLRS